MTKIRQPILVLTMLFVSALSLTAQAQTTSVAVTSDNDRVQFAAQDKVNGMRVEVLSPEGRTIFDSGAVKGRVFEWDMMDNKGEPVPNGVYTSVIRFKDARGKVLKLTEQITVARVEQAAVQPDQPQAPQATITGSGTTGKIAKFTGAATIGNSIITESSSRIGINIATPAALLHVKGTQPAASAGNGTTAVNVLNVVGGKGGNTSGATATAGKGASIFLTAGDGGDATGGGTSGTGGSITLQPGIGAEGVSNGNVLIATKGGSVSMGSTLYPFTTVTITGRAFTGDSALTVTNTETADGGNGIEGKGNITGVVGSGAFGVEGFGHETGVSGFADTGSGGRGVYGSGDGAGSGVEGFSPTGAGVKGSGKDGVSGTSSIANGNGVVGEANNGASAFGVWGKSTSGFAGVFSGKVRITGNLDVGGNLQVSGGTKNFVIDHPLDPANKYLYHAAVESPDMKNIYDGNVTTDAQGNAIVVLPDYFTALNRDYRYQLTVVGQFAQAMVANEIKDNRFTIKTDKPHVKVSWQVTGIRQDAYAKDHPMTVERDKPLAEHGSYLYPQGFGQPAEKGVNQALQSGVKPPTKAEATPR